MSDLLDWQITDAPSPDEFISADSDRPAASHSRRPLPTLSLRVTRRITLTLGGVIVLALTSVGGYWAWNRAQVRTAVERVIARENEANQAADWQALRDLVADTDLADWSTQFYAIPPPLPYLVPTWSDEVRAIVSVAPTLVRAEVITHYRAPNGTPLTFIRDQYYRYLNGTWKRTAAPDETQTETLSFYSAYFRAGYAAVDEARLRPALLEAEAQLARVCALWPCTEAPEIKLSFSIESYLSGYAMYLASSENVLYQTFLNAEGYEWTLTWPAPYQSGYPADEATQQWYQHVLTLSLFQRLTNQLALAHDLDERSVLARALALRLATRLGLDSFPMDEVWVTHPAYTLNELWLGRTAEGGRANMYLWDPSVALRAALVALNRLLRDQPPEVEDRLFAALFDATDEVDWVARGLGVSHYEAQTQLAALAQPEWPTERVLTAPPGKFSLGCGDGLYTYSPGQGAPARLLEGAYLGANVYSWSPDGRRLLVELNGRAGVINFDSHTLTWLPMETENNYYSTRWVNDTIAVYVVYNDYFSPTLRFFDTTQPERSMPVLAGAIDYIRSPDSAMGIVVQLATEGFNNQLALLTSPEERPRPMAEGVMLAWSPDSQFIAYLWRGQTEREFVVRLMDVRTGAVRDLLTDADLLTAVADHIAIDHPPWAVAQWTPDGQRLAFTLTAVGVPTTQSWVGFIDLTSENGWKPLPLEIPENAYLAGISADGQWLAVVVYGNPEFSSPQVTTQLYSATTGQLAHSFPGSSFWGWSPTGHQLALWDDTSLYLLDEPDQLAEPPTPLTNLPCTNLMWNPNP